jgi:hypothetical protein
MPEVIDKLLGSSERLRTKGQLYKLLSPGSMCDTMFTSSKEDSAPLYGQGLPVTFGTSFANVCGENRQELASQIGELYSDFNDYATCVLVGTTGTVSFEAAPTSPSSFPKFAAGYINHLYMVNRTLEHRVEDLEQELNDIRAYWPTIKKLVAEYGAATDRVSLALSQLGRDYNPAQAWRIAQERDVLKEPMEEDAELL